MWIFYEIFNTLYLGKPFQNFSFWERHRAVLALGAPLALCLRPFAIRSVCRQLVRGLWCCRFVGFGRVLVVWQKSRKHNFWILFCTRSHQAFTFMDVFHRFYVDSSFDTCEVVWFVVSLGKKCDWPGPIERVDKGAGLERSSKLSK